MESNVLISVRALCKDFIRPNGTQFTALEGINLDIKDGEFLAIVGLSGSGKSTLLRCMAGLMKPDRGQVSYVKPKEIKQLVSFVFQSFALFPWLTVRENVEAALQYVPKLQRMELADNALNLVGLEGFDDAYPRELSGGMRQRVSIARAMACDPMVMFMDEPFSALDPLTGESLRGEMGRLWMQASRKIRSVVMVTHSLAEALQLADRVIILSSSPGTVYKSIPIPLARPRNSNTKEFLEIERYLERTFGELHLDKLTAAHYDSSAEEAGAQIAVPLKESKQVHSSAVAAGTAGSSDNHQPTQNLLSSATATPTTTLKRVKPLINSSLVLVEGLLTRLEEEKGAMDLYEIADEMGQSVDQMLPAVASAEMLGFIHTPGTMLVLTALGRELLNEQEPLRRRLIMREAVRALPVIGNLYEIVNHQGDEGLEKEIALEQLVIMLPFEDPELQFDAMLKWCRHVNLFSYDSQAELIFSEG